MNRIFARSLLLVSIATVSGLALTTISAHAILTPAGGTVTARSKALHLHLGDYQEIRCPGLPLTGKIAPDGRSIEGIASYDESTCVESLFSFPCRVKVNGAFTLKLTGSVRLTNASLSPLLSGNFSVEVTCSIVSAEVSGRASGSSCVTFTQASQRLNLHCRFSDADGVLLTLVASYAVSPRLTA